MLISVDRRDHLVLARLNREVTNALNLECVNELAGLLRKVKSDPDVHGLVLGSANDRFLSIGFDIPQLFGLEKSEFDSFYRAFNRVCLDLYTLPKPTAAAITGHAIAGGCILALCCDYRFIAQGRRLMGLNEVKLGVPVPYLCDRVLHSLVGTRQAREIMESGEFYTPEDSLAIGLVDQVLPAEQVMARAVDQVKKLGSMPGRAYGLIKSNRTEGIEAEVTAREEEKTRLFVECWYSDEARQRLREAMARF